MGNAISHPAQSAITTTVIGATQMTGWSRSEVYRLLAAGKIRAVRSGSRTLVTVASIRDHIAGLPAATFGVTSNAVAKSTKRPNVEGAL